MSEKQESSSEKKVDLKEAMLKTRSILLTGEVDKDTPSKIIPQLLMLEALDPSAPIYFFIDSPGGSVDSGLAVYNAVRFISSPVYMIGMGLVASIASTIFLAAPKEQRVTFPYTRYLLHQPLGGMRGVVTDIEIHAKEMERTKKELAQIIASATDRNLEEVIKQTDRDYWLVPSEAQEYGLLGHIIEKREELDIILKSNGHVKA